MTCVAAKADPLGGTDTCGVGEDEGVGDITDTRLSELLACELGPLRDPRGGIFAAEDPVVV